MSSSLRTARSPGLSWRAISIASSKVRVMGTMSCAAVPRGRRKSTMAKAPNWSDLVNKGNLRLSLVTRRMGERPVRALTHVPHGMAGHTYAKHGLPVSGAVCCAATYSSWLATELVAGSFTPSLRDSVLILIIGRSCLQRRQTPDSPFPARARNPRSCRGGFSTQR